MRIKPILKSLQKQISKFILHEYIANYLYIELMSHIDVKHGCKRQN